MKGKCRLLEIECDLINSHIYPAFAVEYMKKTGSKYLRTQHTLNLRQQDGLKKCLLSAKAEQMFSLREKWFAEKIFIPYLEKEARSFSYDENLYYFALSFLWRIIILHTDFSPHLKKHWVYPLIVEVEKEWKEFLTSSQYPINSNNVQLLFTDRVKNSSRTVKGLDYYTSRALDGTIITTNDNKYVAVYGKFMRFIFWHIIKSDQPTAKTDALIHPVSGVISIPQRIQDNYLCDFLINRSNEYSKLQDISAKQQNKITEEVIKNKKAFRNSDAGKSIYNDIFNINNGN